MWLAKPPNYTIGARQGMTYVCYKKNQKCSLMNYFHWSQDDDAFSLCWLPLMLLPMLTWRPNSLVWRLPWLHAFSVKNKKQTKCCILGKLAMVSHSAALHFCPAAAAISIVKKHHHLDFNGNNSWNGNAHVTTGTSTIPYEASVLYKILWGQSANRPQQPLEAAQWTILPQFGSVHLVHTAWV